LLKGLMMILNIVNLLAKLIRARKHYTLAEKQLAALSILEKESCPGRVTRQRLMDSGIKMSTTSFYDMMIGMEDEGLIEGRFIKKKINNHITMERWHRIRRNGIKRLEYMRNNKT
jgi:hypothetical protein